MKKPSDPGQTVLLNPEQNKYIFKMNIKAERIEQMIQIVNRNLLLIYAGQREGVTPLDVRKLQRVDAGIFGSDKFAFEMVHFVKSSRDQNEEGSITSFWEKSFLKGLETLLVECAVVKDDIERDCFISRVYCWFTEKLVERRELPRSMNGKNYIYFLLPLLMHFPNYYLFPFIP